MSDSIFCSDCYEKHPFDDKIFIHIVDNSEIVCKFCSACDVFHHIDSFGKTKQSNDGRESQCRHYRNICKNELEKEKIANGTYTKYDYGETKVCTSSDCPHGDEPQPITNFWLKDKKTGRREARCRTCMNAKKDPVIQSERFKEWYYNKNGKEKCKESQEKYKPIRNASNKERRKTDIHYRLKQIVRCRIYDALKNQNTDRQGKNKFLDMDINTYENWLEFQFKPGMTWENQGTVWEIDHVVPCDLFTFTDENDDSIHQCFNWKNTRPMFSSENSSKWMNLDLDAITLHIMLVNDFIISRLINEPLYNGINPAFYKDNAQAKLGIVVNE